MSAHSEAHTYAQVVFETALKDWLDGLEQVHASLQRNPGLARQLANASKEFEARQAMLQPLLPEGMPKSVRNFLYGMVANGDITLLGDVVENLREMATAAGGPKTTKAEITSAIELAEKERSAIEERLVGQFGAGLDFEYVVDPAILGGMVVRVGDKLLDTSVSSRLAALRQSLGVAD